MVAYRDEILEAPGLVGYWPLDFGTADDLSGNGNTGTLQGSPTTNAAGPFASGGGSGAFTFNGSTQYISVANDATHFNVTDVFTVEAWIKLSTANLQNAILSRGPGGPYVRITTNANGGLQLVQDGTANDLTQSTTFTDTTSWHHVVITKNGATRTMWIDGSQPSTAGSNHTFTNPVSALNIGRDVSTSTDFFHGSMAQVAFYSVALSSGQIIDHYNVGATAGTAQRPIPRRMPLGV